MAGSSAGKEAELLGAVPSSTECINLDARSAVQQGLMRVEYRS